MRSVIVVDRSSIVWKQIFGYLFELDEIWHRSFSTDVPDKRSEFTFKVTDVSRQDSNFALLFNTENRVVMFFRNVS
jgi:hypothetical protein